MALAAGLHEVGAQDRRIRGVGRRDVVHAVAVDAQGRHARAAVASSRLRPARRAPSRRGSPPGTICTTFVDRPYFFILASSVWHRAHSSGVLTIHDVDPGIARCRARDGSRCTRERRGCPEASALPCTLFMYVSATSGWHAAQRVRDARARLAAASATSCAPWQSTHPGASSFPLASCLAVDSVDESAYLSKWHGLHASRNPAWNSDGVFHRRSGCGKLAPSRCDSRCTEGPCRGRRRANIVAVDGEGHLVAAVQDRLKVRLAVTAEARVDFLLDRVLRRGEGPRRRERKDERCGRGPPHVRTLGPNVTPHANASSLSGISAHLDCSA